MNRRLLTVLSVSALAVLVGVTARSQAPGLYATSEPVVEADTPPGTMSLWLKNRTAAVYDADSLVWLSIAEDAYYFGRNSTVAANEWLRFGPNGSTSGTGDPTIFAAAEGYYISVPSVITRVDLSIKGEWTSAAACTLMLCQSVPPSTIDTLSFLAFSAPTNLAGSRTATWLEVDSSAVLSAKLLTGAGTVNNPNFTVRVREVRTP